MKRAVFLHIQSILHDYPRMDQYITQRKQATYYCPDDDRVVNSLRWQQEAVAETWSDSDDISKQVINKLYFNHDPNQTIDGLAMELHISRSTLFYKRNKFFESVRHKLGW